MFSSPDSSFCIYKYRSAIEIENYEYVKNIVLRDYATYSGRFLEKYFTEQLKLSYNYSNIGSYWERGHQNEIDIVAMNDEKRTMLFVEVKRNAKKIDLNVFESKASKLMAKYQLYDFKFRGLSLEDVKSNKTKN